MANRKTSQLEEVTTLPDNSLIYAVDESDVYVNLFIYSNIDLFYIY